MNTVKRLDEKTGAAPWRAAYRLSPANDDFEDLLEQFREQDQTKKTSEAKGRA